MVGSLLLQIFSPKKRNICTAFYNFLCGIHQKRDSLVFYSCGKYRNSLMFSVLEPASLSFPEPTSIHFLWYLVHSSLESASLFLWNLHPFPSGTSVPFTLESASFHSGICISFHPEPASLPCRICIPFRLESASLPSRAPSPCVPPRPPRACCSPFSPPVFLSHRQRSDKKKQTSLSLTGSNTALPVTQKLHPSLGFLFEDFAAADSFWVDLRPFVSLARAACKVTKIRSYNNNLQDLQLLVSTVLIAEQ